MKKTSILLTLLFTGMMSHAAIQFAFDKNHETVIVIQEDRPLTGYDIHATVTMGTKALETRVYEAYKHMNGIKWSQLGSHPMADPLDWDAPRGLNDLTRADNLAVLMPTSHFAGEVAVYLGTKAVE